MAISPKFCFAPVYKCFIQFHVAWESKSGVTLTYTLPAWETSYTLATYVFDFKLLPYFTKITDITEKGLHLQTFIYDHRA